MNALTCKNILLLCTSIFLIVSGMNPVSAQPPSRVKFAMAAPKGSIYHRVMQELGQEWRKAQQRRLKFTIYTDSTQGSEADMVRRMRVGQLHGAMLTVVGLATIDPSVSALQKMPMMFRSWDELDYVRKSLRKTLEKRFLEKGFVVLFWGEGGWVQFFATRPFAHPEDLRTSRVFAWAGDNAHVELMKLLGYRPVVLELTDILPGLQTGLIDVVPAAPMFALAAQFDRRAPYMLRMNWVPIVGATVITRKTWDSLAPATRVAVRAAATTAGNALRTHRNTLDENSIAAMQKRGLKVQSATPEIERAWRKLAVQAYPDIRGTMVPAEMFDRVEKLLTEYRAGR